LPDRGPLLITTSQPPRIIATHLHHAFLGNDIWCGLKLHGFAADYDCHRESTHSQGITEWHQLSLEARIEEPSGRGCPPSGEQARLVV